MQQRNGRKRAFLVQKTGPHGTSTTATASIFLDASIRFYGIKCIFTWAYTSSQGQMSQEDLKGQSTSIISWYCDIEFDGKLIILTLSLTHLCEWVCSRTKFETNSVKIDHSVSNNAKIAIKEKVFTIQCCEYYEKISAEFPINVSNVGISNWDLKDSKNKKQQGINASHVRKWTIFKTTETILAILPWQLGKLPFLTFVGCNILTRLVL